MPSHELEQLIQQLRANSFTAPPTIEAQREAMLALASTFPLSPDLSSESTVVNGVPAERVSVPGVARDAIVLYLHGGGFIMGSPRTHREIAGRIARAAGAPVLVPDYRLAPEHPFPAALDDAVAAYRWLLEKGFSPERIAIAGESAGGGLVASTLLALRDAKLPLPGAVVLMSPWLDLTVTAESMTSRAALDPVVQKELLLTMSALYRNGADAKLPTLSPLFGDLSGLPPLLIQVGTAETLLDDSTAFAEKARAAGTEVTLEVCDDLIHAWQVYPMLPEAHEAVGRIGAFLRERLAGQRGA